jgi:hypothetical protein
VDVIVAQPHPAWVSGPVSTEIDRTRLVRCSHWHVVRWVSHGEKIVWGTR